MSTLSIEELRWGDFIDPNQPSRGKYYPLHSFQKQIYESEARFTAGVAGTGGGKTAVGPIWCIKQIQLAIERYGKCLGMVVAPTYKVLSRATMPLFVDTLKATALEGIYKESKSYYELPNDWGRIWAQGADNPGGLEGGQFDFVWGDEGGQFKKATFDAITGRTGAKMAPILITTTPYGLGPLYTEWFKRWKAGDEDYFFVNWSSHINPAYPREEYERARRSMPPEKFRERYDGVFVQLEGLVYPNFYSTHVQMNADEILTLLGTDGRFFGGIDFGWNDPFCALAGFLDHNDILWIWYERYRSQTTMEEHATALPKFAHKAIRWACDNNPEAIRKLRKGGHLAVNAKKFDRGTHKSAIINGILMVNSRIRQDKLRIIKNRCPAVCAEAETYHYPDKDEEIIGDIPADKDNHAMDALRYLITEIDYKKAI